MEERLETTMPAEILGCCPLHAWSKPPGVPYPSCGTVNGGIISLHSERPALGSYYPRPYTLNPKLLAL